MLLAVLRLNREIFSEPIFGMTFELSVQCSGGTARQTYCSPALRTAIVTQFVFAQVQTRPICFLTARKIVANFGQNV